MVKIRIIRKFIKIKYNIFYIKKKITYWKYRSFLNYKIIKQNIFIIFFKKMPPENLFYSNIGLILYLFKKIKIYLCIKYILIVILKIYFLLKYIIFPYLFWFF